LEAEVRCAVGRLRVGKAGDLDGEATALGNRLGGSLAVVAHRQIGTASVTYRDPFEPSRLGKDGEDFLRIASS
jgi:hypothetical protein